MRGGTGLAGRPPVTKLRRRSNVVVESDPFHKDLAMSTDSTRRIHLDQTWPGAAREGVLSLDDTATFLRAVKRLEEAPAVSSTAKGVLDVTLSVILLGLFAPVLRFAMLLIKLTSRGSAIFLQQRIGYQGR